VPPVSSTDYSDTEGHALLGLHNVYELHETQVSANSKPEASASNFSCYRSAYRRGLVSCCSSGSARVTRRNSWL
jgi:hypothetical protein